MDAVCWRGPHHISEWVCICVAATLPYENLLHHHLQLAMRRSKFRRCSADEMTMMTMLLSSDQQHPAIQPSNNLQPASQPTNRPNDRGDRPCFLMRGEAIVYRQFSCRAEVNADQKRAKGKALPRCERAQLRLPIVPVISRLRVTRIRTPNG